MPLRYLCPLEGAIRTGDNDEALRLIATRQHIHTQDSEGHTALYWAADTAPIEIIDALLAAGADLEAASGPRRNYVKADWLELERCLCGDVPAARAIAWKLYRLGDAAEQPAAWKILADRLGLDLSRATNR